ncbi:ATP-binding protein [Paraburkholderia sp. DHOC27]|uniref:hybrid sensor histidine kinase/response regulator n=1 Tax=Paraburkholderia sp. DHOC27 TaxID=2303330 RepID=UPI000E3C6290|nr:ATP-binding protein [Paraburkholderia sp. DHOC27]RFU49685.1 hybrid sensor histidine kinase/response regulator [Paraburkholderia sp. DHOC27]
MSIDQYQDESPESALRDLMGLLALPALWPGRDGSAIVALTTQAIERIVPLDVCYVAVPLLPETPPHVQLRVRGELAGAEALRGWQDAIGEWNRLPIGTRVNLCDTPLGQIRMIRLSVGFSSGQGSIWFGSLSPTFPKVNQIAFLRAATSQAATGILAARAAHEREEANRSKDEFLAMLGHELRNPLAPIVTALGLIRRENGNLADKYHEILERQVAHLSRLVEDLLDVSRITRGKIELQRESLRIGSVITRAVEAASPLVEQRHQRLLVVLSDDGAQIHGDLTRLTQAFSNLLNNAAKYTDVGGEIRVNARTTGSHVTVSISDDGAGISPELMPKLFRIFEQGRTTIDRSKGGLGIGLALVKNLVELHGGSVHAASEGPGKGATFTVTLPLATGNEIANAFAPRIQLPEISADRSGTRVLLVDDNMDGLLSMEAFLTDVGFDVATAFDPLQALDLAAQFRPDLAVLDIGLPGMDGYELALALRAQPQHAAMRLFALSGYGQVEDLKRSLAAGFERHFVKPVALMELVDALKGDAPEDGIPQDATRKDGTPRGDTLNGDEQAPSGG